jgi:hypothetical protein
MSPRALPICILLLAGAALPAGADPAGFAFLEVPAGARASALGGAYASVGEGVESAYWNPAGLEATRGTELMAGHYEFIQGLRHEQFAVAGRQLGGGVALALRAMYSEGIEERDELGNLLGTFGAQDLDFGLSYGRQWMPGVRAGVSLHWIRERIQQEAVNAFAGGLGATWQPPGRDALRLALTLQNLGAAPHYTIDGVRGEPVPLPVSVQGGASYRWALGPGWSALGSLETRFTRGRSGVVLSGFELASATGGRVSAGWRGNDDAASFSGGAGWKLGQVEVDYAFVPYRLDLGDTHRIALLARF